MAEERQLWLVKERASIHLRKAQELLQTNKLEDPQKSICYLEHGKTDLARV